MFDVVRLLEFVFDEAHRQTEERLQTIDVPVFPTMLVVLFIVAQRSGTLRHRLDLRVFNMILMHCPSKFFLMLCFSSSEPAQLVA